MNNLEELNRKAQISRLKSKFEVAKSYGSDQLTVPMPDLEALIAQLEAAQKLISEDGKLQYIRRLEAEKQTEANTINIQRRQNLELMSENANLKDRAEKAEAELSAANEKLSKPVVLPDDGLEDCINMWPDNWRNDFDTGYNFGIWRCEQNIKAAGFTVEE